MTPSIKLAAAALTRASILGVAACERVSPEREAAATTTATPPAPEPATVTAQAHAFRIGAVEAWALRDGRITLPVASEHLPWADKPAVTEVLTQAGLPGDIVHLSVQPLLVRDGDRLVLIDTGAGGWMNTENLLSASLTAAGVRPDQITDILISHAHGDHIGGLIDAQGRLAFPNAVVRMTAAEWEHMRANAEADGVADTVSAITPKVQTFEAAAQITPSINAVPLRGHTPGHSGFEIISGADSLLYVGDALHSSIISVQRPDWLNAWDIEAATGAATRQTLLERAAGAHSRLYGVHFPYPGLGRIERRDDGFVWIPEG